MAHFGFRAASSLIWRDGGLLFHLILSKIVVSTSPEKNGFPFFLGTVALPRKTSKCPSKMTSLI